MDKIKDNNNSSFEEERKNDNVKTKKGSCISIIVVIVVIYVVFSKIFEKKHVRILLADNLKNSGYTLSADVYATTRGWNIKEFETCYDLVKDFAKTLKVSLNGYDDEIQTYALPVQDESYLGITVRCLNDKFEILRDIDYQKEVSYILLSFPKKNGSFGGGRAMYFMIETDPSSVDHWGWKNLYYK